jgi:hypothetical protein
MLRDEVNQLQSADQLRQALARTQQALVKAKFAKDELISAVYQAAKDAALAVEPVRIKPIAKDKRTGKPEVALVHLTDWQYGKQTVSYGPSTCAQRIGQFIDKTIHITDIQRKHHPVREVYVLLGGDMVEGLGIFPGQVYEVHAHLYEQLFTVSQIITQSITTLAQHFEKVHVVCEYGNHGRLGRKGEMPGGDNIDRIAYEIARDKCKGLTASWQSSGDWYQIARIGNYKALLVHGDEIKSFGGNTPAFGILRKVNAWAGGVIEEFTDCYMGHWHTPMSLTMGNGNRIFVTGSPESHNEYAREFVAATGKPSQRLHFIDPAKGRVAAEYVVWLD